MLSQGLGLGPQLLPLLLCSLGAFEWLFTQCPSPSGAPGLSPQAQLPPDSVPSQLPSHHLEQLVNACICLLACVSSSSLTGGVGRTQIR